MRYSFSPTLAALSATLFLGACAIAPVGSSGSASDSPPSAHPATTGTGASTSPRSIQPRPREATKPPALVMTPPPPDPASNIFFSSGSDRIGPAGLRLLKEMAEKLKGKVRTDITLVGHTDDAGSTEFNIALAQRRVEAVAGQLEALGVSSRQIRRISYGNEAAGPATCGTVICRDRERRVELQLSEPD